MATTEDSEEVVMAVELAAELTVAAGSLRQGAAATRHRHRDSDFNCQSF